MRLELKKKTFLGMGEKGGIQFHMLKITEDKIRFI